MRRSRASRLGKAMELAYTARDSLTVLHEHHRTVALATEWLRSQWNGRGRWQNYHLGIAFGLSGRVKSAQHQFRLAVDPLSEYEWEKALSRECEAYTALVADCSEAVIATVRKGSRLCENSVSQNFVVCGVC
jgi:hypothetical protein